MRLVAEGLRLGAAAAAQHDRLALRQLVLVPVRVDQPDRPGDLVGPAVADLDLYKCGYSAGLGSSSAGGASGASGSTSGSSGSSVGAASSADASSTSAPPTPAATFLRF